MIDTGLIIFPMSLYNKLEVDLKNFNFKGLAKLRPLRPGH
jgi:hypothetical protein